MNWQRWFRPGLVVTVVLAVVAIAFRGGLIADDVQSRVQAQLMAQGMDWATTDGAWREVTITGIAPSQTAQALAVDTASRVPGVRAVIDRSNLLPLQSPFVWTARKTGPLVELTGYVPSEGVRAAMLAEARRAFPANEIRADLELARGAPPAFTTAVAFALGRLSGLADGLVALNDATLAVSGTALDAAALAEARQAFATAVPAELTVGPVEILPARADRFVWSAGVEGETAVVSGFIPNDVVRDMVALQVGEALPGKSVSDQMVVASGEPEGFIDAVDFAITALTRLETGGVTLDELALDIAGTARSVDDYENLLSQVGGNLPAGMSVVAAEVTPATVSDYGWRGRVNADGAVLTGYVASLEDQRNLVDAARALFAGRALRSQVRVARGGPPIDWIGGVDFALRELARLARGSVSIDHNAAYAIEGEALSSDDYRAITDVTRGTLPASLSLSQLSVAAPVADTYRLFAERDGDTLVITGSVADRTRHGEVLTLAGRMFVGMRIADRTEFASGAPDGFFQTVEVGFRALSRMTGGRFRLIDSALDITGFTTHEGAWRDIGAALENRLPNGYELVSDINVLQRPQLLSAEACSAALTEAVVKGRLEFVGTSSEMSRESLATLDRIAWTIARCPETTIEIGVHSDSDGSRSANQRRTLARAETIEDFMIDAGIRRERLTAVGHGEAQPVASNATAQGKAANRRIEFALAVPEPPPQPAVVTDQPAEPGQPSQDSPREDGIDPSETSIAAEPPAEDETETGEGAAP